MKIRSSNLATGSRMAGFTAGMKNFPEMGRGLGHVTLLKMLTPSIFLERMKVHSEFGK